jgi:hypothetical protein
MGGIQESSNFSDVDNSSYLQGVISVTTSQVEAKVGASRLTSRQNLRIFNNSDRTIYFGPSGVTSSIGEPLYKQQWVELPVGDSIGVYLITASGTATDIRIQEIG